MQLPYSEELNIGYLSRLFDNTSNCYKFFWFQAIIRKLQEDKMIILSQHLSRVQNQGYGYSYKRCRQCGFMTSEDFGYCPKCGIRF